ncbi:TIGR03084 family protein [Amycolatopsis sp. WAC 01376]|uniref:TIGR03084 family metal-binding protein n=1 Tax=Amycolatopsis sp. WAC 01376 TaxID=2203195 RepID=UPI000F797326|nr:TIGR03084 family metal-binding protein [Amycolatopsis sp. WAC 01376]RSM56196.1 TIGR03084 family protein [Amycolatopsis sp. WAC 01376]
MTEIPKNAGPIIKGLIADAAEFDELVAGLPEQSWLLPTPAPGWTIRDQVAHVSFVFRLAGLAAADAAAFQAATAKLDGGFSATVNAALADYAGHTVEELSARWRSERDTAIRALTTVPPGRTVPWLVDPLPPDVLACAGMMELFGHGQDIADTLGIRRRRTDRLRYLAGFGVRTWEFGYRARGLTPPESGFHFELIAPSGAVWEFGPDETDQRITGPAEDFCLLVTRRRHRDDLELVASGADADHWLDIAQAYRGPAGPGREPGQFSGRPS